MANNMNVTGARRGANGSRNISGDPGRALPAQTDGPLAALAKKIRSEQGVSGLTEFLAAMAPFAAPNELRRIASEHGVEYEPAVRPQEPPSVQPRQTGGQPGGPDLMRMMQLMQVMNGMKTGRSGMDPMQLITLLGGNPKASP